MAGRILIIDDTPEIQRLLQMVLRFEGFEIAGVAESADEGVRLSESMQPDGVVLDVMMPGKSGLDAIEEIRTKAPETKILVFSSVGVSDDTRQEAMQRGAHGYLNKVQVEEVPERLRELLTTAEGE